MKKQFKNFFLLVLLFFGFINRFTPKYKVIMFFTNNSETNDNNLALLKKLVEKGYAEKYKIYFFSKDGERYKHFNGVIYKNTLLAPLWFLFSRYCFYDCGTLKIKPSKSQMVISLWHGVPLKKIGLMVGEQSSKLDRYNDFTKIIVPHSSWASIYMQSFDCTKEQILINGFPRNDYLFHPNKISMNKLGVVTNHEKMILWMPTFRKSTGGRYSDSSIVSADWDLPLFVNLKDIDLFNMSLKKIDVCLVIKLHPYSVLNKNQYPSFSNIYFIKNSDLNKNSILNYEFVACFDALVTDYSSILFDYLLLDKPIAFTVDDFDDYSNARGFSVADPEQYLVGNKISTSDDLLSFIQTTLAGVDLYSSAREEIRRTVHENVDDGASQRLISFIGL